MDDPALHDLNLGFFSPDFVPITIDSSQALHTEEDVVHSDNLLFGQPDVTKTMNSDLANLVDSSPLPTRNQLDGQTRNGDKL